MSDPQTPEFGDEFWNLVHQRAVAVRAKVHEEIEQAEHLVFSETEMAPAVGPDGNVLPVFTDPFWTEVQMRAERVHELARETLAAAEAKLLDGDEAQGPADEPARRPAAGRFRNLARTFNLQRADAFGLVAALLAVILLVPQLIAPVYSSAGVEPPRLLRFVTIGGGDSGEKQVPKETTEEGSHEASAATGGKSAAATPQATSTPSPGASASNGASSAANGEGGITGGAASGAPGATTNGTSDVAPQPSPSPAASPAPQPAPPPAAPVEVHVIPVGSRMVRVAWTDVSNNETGYQVDMQVPEGSAASTQQADKDSGGLTWTNLTPESKVCFRVRSVADTEHSDWAPAAAPGYACATLPAEETTPPAGSGGAQPEPSPSPAPPAG